LSRVDESLGRAELLLACSSGGHLMQLMALRPAWQDLDRVWVTFDKSDVDSLLRDEEVVFAYGPTNRSLKNLVRNLVLAWRVIGRVRPRVVLTTGAGVAVPFAWVGRLRGARVLFVESLTRIDGPSMSCRMIAPVAERVYVQWPELAERYPRAVYRGAVVSRR
jgi:UDP-N-acetylglucosamine:LPS N-acetylglucosamine transferase